MWVRTLPLALVALSCSSTERGRPAAGSASLAASAAPRRELAVPLAPPPTLDGKVDDQEWSRATSIGIGRDVTLRLMHDGAKLYLAVSGLDPTANVGFGCIFVADDDEVAVFHASARLGSARYTASSGASYQPRAKQYDWRDPQVLLRDEGWTGTTVSPDAPLQQELAVTFERLGLPDHPRPLAFGYFVTARGAKDLGAARALVWPVGLDDAVATVELLAGLNPDDLRFDPARWMIVRPQAR